MPFFPVPFFLVPFFPVPFFPVPFFPVPFFPSSAVRLSNAWEKTAHAALAAVTR